MERILDSVKYKLLFDHKEKLSKPKFTIEQRKKTADAEIENLKKLIELCKIEEEDLSAKVAEAADFEQMNEVKLLIEKEKQNQEVLKKTIRELRKEGSDNGKTLQRLNSNTNQYESFVDLNMR
jgi:rubrerythrin